MVLGAVLALFAVMALTATAAALALGERLGVAAATGLTLAQVGEFSFVLAAAGLAEGLTPAGLGTDGTQAFIAATVLLMAATPWLTGVGARLGVRMAPAEPGPTLPGRDTPQAGANVAEGIADHVVVAGYGRWGRGVTRVLKEAGIPQVVATLSPHGAVDAYDQGVPVLLGDPARLRTLAEAGVERARMVVIPDDAAERARQIVRVVRGYNPDVTIVVRTRYANDVDELEADGATFVVTEEVEASAMLATKVLKTFGARLEDAMMQAHAVRGFYRDDPERAPVVPPQHAVVDTNALVDVALDPDACPHADQVEPVVPRTAGCEECLERGDSWVHLRLCLTCGHVGCCDSSPNRHARHHHEDVGHHVARSAEPGESWVYCFADDRLLVERDEGLLPR
jgi:CPA2 family monovalent cation:H+ antiporter-2